MCLFFLLSVLTGCDSLPFDFGLKSLQSASSPSQENAANIGSPDLNAPPTLVDPLAATGPIDLSPEGSLGALGLNFETYFEGNIGTPNERINRVERALTAVQQDMRRLAPPIRRLITIERDIQALISQLAALSQAPPTDAFGAPIQAQAPMQVASSNAIQSSPPVRTAATVSSMPSSTGGKIVPNPAAGAVVNDIRIGEHKDKTRLVIDVSAAATYSYDLDNTENLLVIELPNTGWSGPMKWASDEQPRRKKSPLLASYTVVPSSQNGHRVIVQLKQNAKVSYESAYKANGNPNYRIVIDLHSNAIHRSSDMK
jgi:hypothetical protein